MSLKQQIDDDLKTAMLAGEKTLVTTLRGLKAVILNEEVAKGLRDSGLADDVVIALLSKEAKKRQESADLFGQGGNTVKQQEELAEKVVIEKYLPAQLSEAEITALVDAAIAVHGSDKAAMGKIMAEVKEKAGATADGAMVAQIVRGKLA